MGGTLRKRKVTGQVDGKERREWERKWAMRSEKLQGTTTSVVPFWWRAVVKIRTAGTGHICIDPGRYVRGRGYSGHVPDCAGHVNWRIGSYHDLELLVDVGRVFSS